MNTVLGDEREFPSVLLTSRRDAQDITPPSIKET